MHSMYAESTWPAGDADGRAAEQKHLLEYAPMVKHVVQQLTSQVGGIMGADDMLQIGLIGLLDALRRYGTPDDKFAGFARPRVRGAILDELRRQDWRPRTVRQESHRIRDGIRRLTRSLGREPSRAEIVGGLGVTDEAYQSFELARNAEELASFDQMVQEIGQFPEERPRSPEAQFILRRSIEQALRNLSERERRVVQLYYEFELNLAEIAAVLQISEARVCQINKSALRKMKDVLQERHTDPAPGRPNSTALAVL